jgi:hypothetical protein
MPIKSQQLCLQCSRVFCKLIGSILGNGLSGCACQPIGALQMSYSFVQIPDVSAVLHTSDYPCLKANRSVADIEFRQPDTTLPDDHWNGAAETKHRLLC